MRKLFMPYAILISIFVAHHLNSIVPIVAISEIPILQLTPVAEQVSLSFTWSYTMVDRLSHDTADMRLPLILTFCQEVTMQGINTFEPPHDKTNKMACAPSEDSDQPEHLPSLIRVFAVRMKKAYVLSYPLSASEDSDQTGRIPRLIWIFAGRTVILWFCHDAAHLEVFFSWKYSLSCDEWMSAPIFFI